MIKNIIFDLGGVLLDIDFKLTTTAFENLGVQNPAALITQFTANDLFQKLEKGLLTDIAFYDEFRVSTHTKLSNLQIQTAWNALLMQYRANSLDYLNTLSNHYSLYLLSNTNKIHYDSFSETLKKTTTYNSLEGFFTKAYFSHEIHLRKPDKEIFEYVLQDASIQAHETLFIDDTYTNLPEAEALGFKTHLLTPGEKIEDLNYSDYCSASK